MDRSAPFGNMKSSRKVTILLCASLLSTVYCDDCKGNSESMYTKLHSCIKSNYDSTFRPVKDVNSAVNVNVSFIVRYVDMNEKANILTAHVYVELAWMDQFIKWEPADYSGIKRTIVSAGEVWVPDLQVYNDRVHLYGRSDVYGYDVHVYYSGLMYSVAQGEMIAHCNLDIYKWPFDRHTCTAYVGSTNYFGNEMNINFAKQKVKTSMYLNSSIWELEGVSAKRTNFTQMYGNGTKYEYLRMDVTFVIRRYSSALFATVVVPVVSSIVLTLCSLWMDPQEMIRIISILTSVVVQTSMLLYLGSYLPSNAKKGVLIITLLRDSLILTFLSFVVTILNRNLLNVKTPPPHQVTTLIGKVTTSGPSKFLLLPEESAANATEDEVSLVKPVNKYKHEWTLITSLIDRLTFVLFSFVYAVLYIIYTTL